MPQTLQKLSGKVTKKGSKRKNFKHQGPSEGQKKFRVSSKQYTSYKRVTVDIKLVYVSSIVNLCEFKRLYREFLVGAK